jgi:soluble lytic murein transglycosylase-like protein
MMALLNVGADNTLAADQTAIPAGYVQIAGEYGMPPDVLYRLALHQSGARLDSGQHRPWPWTISVDGRLARYRTREDAYRAIRHYLDRGRVVDVGLLLLDRPPYAQTLGDPWSVLDPLYNLRLGAYRLRQRFTQTQDWTSAVAAFATPKAAGSVHTSRPLALNWPGHRQFVLLMRETALRYQLEPELLYAVVAAESNFRPRARSAAGAQGLMQLMPATARRFGVTDSFDPAANLDGGARYLRLLLDQFQDLTLALAGYNAGEQAVIRHRDRIPPYRETQQFVPRVLALYQFFRTRGVS